MVAVQQFGEEAAMLNIIGFIATPVPLQAIASPLQDAQMGNFFSGMVVLMLMKVMYESLRV